MPKALTSADDPGANAPGAGAVIRRLASALMAGRQRRRRWSGTHAPSVTVGVELRRGIACGPDIRAVQKMLLTLDESQREDLKAAVQELPEQAGIQLANWYRKGVRDFV